MPTPTTAALANIETIIRLESENENSRSAIERISEDLGRFAGTLSFVVVELGLVGAWVAINLSKVWINPFPFPLLSTVLAFQSVLLTAFVLMRQNRMSERADKRNHLALQINLLAEQEATKIIQMLQRMSRQMGIEDAVIDSESKALGSATSIDALARGLRDSLGEEAKAPPTLAAKT